ncbi:hypothetical protein ES703_58004 [subsurface metagenome]
MAKKGTKLPNPHKDMELLPAMLIDDYNELWDTDINQFLDSTKVHVTVVLTKKLVDAYNKTPELRYKLSQRLRFLAAQDLINNGYGSDRVEDKLKLIHKLKRNLESSETILLDHRRKRTEEKLKKSEAKAEKVKLQDQFAKFIKTESTNYGEQLKIRLRDEKPNKAKQQIMELIDKRLRPEVLEHFNKEMTAEGLYKSMRLDEIV